MSASIANRMIERWRAAGALPWLLGLAAAVRLYRLGTYSIWADEAITLYDGVHGITFHAPLFVWLATAWSRLAVSDGALRLLPVAFGLIGVGAAWRIGNRLGGRRLAQAAAAYMALAPLGVYYSRELRMYGPFMSLALLSWDRFLALAEGWSRPRLAGYVIVTVLMLNMHDFGALVFACQILAVPAASAFRPAWRRLIAGAALAGLAWLPHLARLLFIAGRIQQADFWPNPVTWRTPFMTLRFLSAGYEPPAWIYLPLALLTVGLACLGSWRAEDRRLRALFVFGAVAPMALALAASVLLPRSIYVLRYLVPCVGPLAVAAAAGTLALPGAWAGRLVAGLMAILQFGSITYQYRNIFAGGSLQEVRPRYEFRLAAEFVADRFRPGDVVGTTCESGSLPCWYYLEYRRGLPPNRLLDLEGKYEALVRRTYNMEEYSDRYSFENDRDVAAVAARHRGLWLYATQWNEENRGPDDFFRNHRLALRRWLGERYPVVMERSFRGVEVTLFDLTRPLAGAGPA